MSLHRSLLQVFFAVCIPCLAFGQTGSDLNAKRLEQLRKATAKMFDTANLGRDSCLHVSMRITTVPVEGERTTDLTELHHDARSMWFTSGQLREYATTKEHVRIWPSEQLVMISKSDSRTLQRSHDLMAEVNKAISEFAKVTRAEEFTEPNGDRMLRMTLDVYSKALNGMIQQTVELNVDQNTVRSVDMILPKGHPLRSCRIDYLVFERTKKPRTDPFVSGLLAQRGPVTRYRDHDVKDLRNSK